jgi:hypothetical protein
MGDEGWNPRRETLCEYVSRKRNAEQMEAYDDQAERRFEESRAHGFYWHKRPDPNTAAGERQARAKTRRRSSVRLPKRATKETAR